MKFGKDFFKILGLIIAIMRLFAGAFGDSDDQAELTKSRDRTASADPDEVC